MSGECEAVDTACCAYCGTAEIDDIKLVPCDDCDLVRYCSDECLREHKSQHEEACKKRAAELRDERLFKQPEGSHNGECPICSLPLSLDRKNSNMWSCCSKVICNGCNYANKMREIELRLEQRCPFCRKALPDTKEEADELRKKRIEANDPFAMCSEGMEQRERGDYIRAFEYFTKAAELGDAQAHSQLANMYLQEHGVEKDTGKYIHHLEEAAIGGHPSARYALGICEYYGGDEERAVKHFIIAAALGLDASIKKLMEGFKEG